MKYLKMRGVLAAAMIAFALPAAAEGAKDKGDSDWEIMVGLGAMYGPNFEGSDTSTVGVLPMFNVTWRDRVFFGMENGLGVHVYKTDKMRISTSIGYDGGRDEDDSKLLSGLGDVDGSATLNASIEYELGPITPFAEVSQHLGGSNGLQAEFGIEAGLPIAVLLGKREFRNKDATAAHVRNGTMLMAEISTDWASDSYMQDYFGVNARQSAASGLGQFNAGAGFKSVNASVGMMVPLGEHLMLNSRVGYSQLIGDAADSPITRDDGQFTAGLFLAYRF